MEAKGKCACPPKKVGEALLPQGSNGRHFQKSEVLFPSSLPSAPVIMTRLGELFAISLLYPVTLPGVLPHALFQMADSESRFNHPAPSPF